MIGFPNEQRWPISRMDTGEDAELGWRKLSAAPREQLVGPDAIVYPEDHLLGHSIRVQRWLQLDRWYACIGTKHRLSRATNASGGLWA